MVMDARNGSLAKFSFDDVALFMFFMFHEINISSGSFPVNGRDAIQHLPNILC